MAREVPFTQSRAGHTWDTLATANADTDATPNANVTPTPARPTALSPRTRKGPPHATCDGPGTQCAEYPPSTRW